jgi:hypothetical protein
MYCVIPIQETSKNGVKTAKIRRPSRGNFLRQIKNLSTHLRGFANWSEKFMPRARSDNPGGQTGRSPFLPNFIKRGSYGRADFTSVREKSCPLYSSGSPLVFASA